MRKQLIIGMMLAVGACQSNSLHSSGTGGLAGSGGNRSNTGGSTNTGGTSGSGGIQVTEGITVTGGIPGSGGITVTGGTIDTGGITSTGGITGSGGLSRSGGAGGAGGSGGTIPSLDASLDGRMDSGIAGSAVDRFPATDSASNSCENPLPLRCGDRVDHSTLMQGRANAWSMYSCTARLMSGREVIYALSSPTTCRVSAQLKNSTPELYLLQIPRCDPVACTAIPESPQTFTIDAGQTKLLVVDGYAGAAGSYTLAVDCDCTTDAGIKDAPAPDAPSDTAATPVCDPKVATPALSALGIMTTIDQQLITLTLPLDLAADANWGLKATVCQQAGYDLSALAGKPVCLLGQDMTDRCQGNPATAWVVMNNGVVACVYKSVRQGYGAAPGVYAANDPACTPPAIAPEATVSCDSRSCTNATGPCCPAASSMNRVGMCGSKCFVAVTCDGPEDCAAGTVCCSLESATGFAGTSCLKPDECMSPSRLVCHQPADCPAPKTCGQPNPLPVEISTIPNVKPDSWRVDYQVCAP